MLYQLKKFVLRPRTAYRRHRAGEMNQIGRVMCELHYYRQPFLEFAAQNHYQPDLLEDIDLPERPVIVDVGAFEGEWAVKMIDRYDATVHAFEPAPEPVATLEALAVDHPDLVVHPWGLADRSFDAHMALHGQGSSIYDAEGRDGSTEVPIKAGDQALAELGIDHIDLIKINIEGAEYDLLDHLFDHGWAEKTDRLLIQFHEWHPWAYWRRHKIRRRLARTHREVWNYGYVFELWAPLDGETVSST